MNLHAWLTICLFTLLVGCATQQVSYQNDVAPILQSRCANCHVAPVGSGYKATGLTLDSYDALMQGTVFGPVIIAGDSRRSILNMLVEGRAGELQSVLHKSGGALSEQELKLLSDWVNQGALNN